MGFDVFTEFPNVFLTEKENKTNNCLNYIITSEHAMSFECKQKNGEDIIGKDLDHSSDC